MSFKHLADWRETEEGYTLCGLTADTDTVEGERDFNNLPPDDRCEDCETKRAKLRHVPTYIVCPKCKGHGKHVHDALSVWTESDRAEDPEGFEDMMGGRYDVVCTLCHGERVIDDSPPAQEKRQYDYEDRLTRAQEDGDWETYRAVKAGLY